MQVQCKRDGVQERDMRRTIMLRDLLSAECYKIQEKQEGLITIIKDETWSSHIVR